MSSPESSLVGEKICSGWCNDRTCSHRTEVTKTHWARAQQCALAQFKVVVGEYQVCGEAGTRQYRQKEFRRKWRVTNFEQARTTLRSNLHHSNVLLLLMMNLHDFLDFAFDHLDLNTAELVASRNYKQALKNLDKRRKKDDATYTQIVRATIAYLLHDYDNSLSLLNDYVKNYKPSYGPDVCERLYINLYALKSVGKEVKDKQLEDVFVQSIAAERDRDEKANLARDWIFLAIGRGQWHFVVKVRSPTVSCALTTACSNSGRRKPVR